MKKWGLLFAAVVIVLLLAIAIWQAALPKTAEGTSPEGSACKLDKDCKAGLFCTMEACSSGNPGSPCTTGADCKTAFCVNFACTNGAQGDACHNLKNCQDGLMCVNGACASGNKGAPCMTADDCLTKFCARGTCTNGAEGDACETYKQCSEGLFCKESLCKGPEPPPAYADYFEKIELHKFNISNGNPGPDNPSEPTTDFKTSGGILLMVDAKEGIGGEAYFDVLNATSGEQIFTYPKWQMYGNMGRGFPMLPAGEYELRFYFENKSMHTILFGVSG
ncbi:MAG: hypothetical protein MSIBF_02310 [Candidatus Altiarchaeales archaeon IMC4]|nr:MAG: hypothetical protein MSIBF_02310 [Candidatus Altiarchaeales archaeon IMC4]